MKKNKGGILPPTSNVNKTIKRNHGTWQVNYFKIHKPIFHSLFVHGWKDINTDLPMFSNRIGEYNMLKLRGEQVEIELKSMFNDWNLEEIEIMGEIFHRAKGKYTNIPFNNISEIVSNLVTRTTGKHERTAYDIALHGLFEKEKTIYFTWKGKNYKWIGKIFSKSKVGLDENNKEMIFVSLDPFWNEYIRSSILLPVNPAKILRDNGMKRIVKSDVLAFHWLYEQIQHNKTIRVETILKKSGIYEVNKKNRNIHRIEKRMDEVFKAIDRSGLIRIEQQLNKGVYLVGKVISNKEMQSC